MSRPRTFDYEEARRLRAAGLSYVEIGRRFGVSDYAVTYACMDQASRDVLASARRAWRDRTEKPCKGGCGRTCKYNRSGEAGYCVRCTAFRRATTVREAELRCAKCGEWKPDEAFPLNRNKIARRRRHSVCRPCQTLVKREQRRENREHYRTYERERGRRRKATS